MTSATSGVKWVIVCSAKTLVFHEYRNFVAGFLTVLSTYEKPQW